MPRLHLAPFVMVVLVGGPDRSWAQDSADRITDVEERLDLIEKQTVLDRLRLTGEYRTVVNAFRYEGPSPDPYDKEPTNPAVGRAIKRITDEIWSHRLRVGLLAEPVSSVRVTARMVMYKQFGDGDSAPFIPDSSGARMPRDSAVRFDQAWIDWFATEWLALSTGRIAYVEGNPAELKEGSTVRRATWGTHMVDGEYDTANLTFNLSRVVDGLYVRLFYASWFNDNDSDVFGSLSFIGSGTDSLRIFGGNIDLKIPGLGNNFVQLGYYNVPDFRPMVVPIPDPTFDPSSDPTRAPAPLNGSLLFPSHMPDSMGSYSNISALWSIYDAFGSGLDVFASGAMGFLKPNGEGIEYMLPSDPMDPSSPRQSTPFLFLASEGDDGQTTFFYAGLRYSLPVREKLLPMIGFEYNQGSRYLISFATPTDQLVTKLATRGKAYETYFILPINDALFVRLSHLYIDGDYQGGFFGPNPMMFGSTSLAASQKIQNFNLTLNATL